MDTLTIKPYSDRKVTHTALNRRLEFEAGNEQIQRVSVNTKTIWELNFEGVYDTMIELRDFFDAHAPGGISFYWTDETAEQHTVRFASDTCDINQKYGCDDDGFGVKGFTCTLQLRKVWDS